MAVEKLSVKDSWSRVKPGDRVRIYYINDGPMWEGTVVQAGKQLDGSGFVKGAIFSDCKTLNIDGSARKGGRKERRGTYAEISGRRKFSFMPKIADVKLPTTVAELTDEHIGMKFEFHGTPEIHGTFEGKRTDTSIHVADVTYDSWEERDGEMPDPDKWSKAKRFHGYAISVGAKVVYIGGEKSGVGVDTDAQLAAYFNQELAKTSGFKAVGVKWLEKYSVGNEIVRIVKELTG